MEVSKQMDLERRDRKTVDLKEPSRKEDNLIIES